MAGAIVVFSHDPEVLATLPVHLRESLELHVETVGTCSELLDRLTHNPEILVFFDIRPEPLQSEANLFLHELEAGRVQPHYLVTLSDGWLPFRWASTIQRHEFQTLEFPCNWEQLDCLARCFRPQMRRPPGHIAAPSCAIASEQFVFNTYTPALFSVLKQLRRVAAHDVTLMLIGETGTGKTTLAQLVHGLSGQRHEPFLNVACGAMPADLIESELFGHVKGAFTSADRSRIGRFEAAGRGTLLLDEIDTLSMKEQAKLLRVIETGEFEPVGSTETRVCQARLIVASNVNLELLTSQNRFRTDLYYRLNVLQFHLPPLRERPLDIVPLSLQFVEESAKKHSIDIKRVHREFLAALRRYSWPGNLRELKNQLQRSVLFCDDGVLTVEQLSPVIVHAQQVAAVSDSSSSVEKSSLAAQVAKSERQILEEALRANGYKRTATARSLGITRVGLYKKMRRYGMLDLDTK